MFGFGNRSGQSEQASDIDSDSENISPTSSPPWLKKQRLSEAPSTDNINSLVHLDKPVSATSLKGDNKRAQVVNTIRYYVRKTVLNEAYRGPWYSTSPHYVGW